MRIYFLLVALLLASCAQDPGKPTVLAAYHYQQHPTWQSAILQANQRQKYNLVFCNLDTTSKDDCFKDSPISLILSDFKFKGQYPSVQPKQIRQQILRQHLTKTTRVITEANTSLQTICKSQRPWLIDLGPKATVQLLKRMPRACQAKIISVTANLEAIKHNPYWASIFQKIHSININAEKIMQNSFKKLDLMCYNTF